MGGKVMCKRVDGLSRDGECVRREINLHRDVFVAIWSESLLMKKTEWKEEKLSGSLESTLLHCTVPAASPIQVTWGCFPKDF